MDRLHLMKVFVTVGEEKNFAAAARRLGMSRATITRAIASLEENLSVKLIQRTTRSVRLTDVGGRYLEDVKVILAKIAESEESLADSSKVIQGQLNVTAPVLFGTTYVMPCIAQYLEKFPAMKVSGFFLDRVVNMIDEGMDVAIRIGHLPDSSLKAITVGKVRRVLCASPQYLKERGVPQQPDDLQRHAIVAATNISPTVEWRFVGDKTVRITPKLTVNGNDAAIRAAVMGIGITRLLSYQIAPYLKSGQLQIVMSNYEEAPWPIQVVHSESRYGSLKVREFIEMLVSQLRQNKDLNF